MGAILFERHGRVALITINRPQNVKHSLGLANRGYVLENGRIVLSGEGKELLNHEGLRKAYLGM